jgi:serine/threonine protein kinase HipA of HipAB toxin-antitoxin module
MKKYQGYHEEIACVIKDVVTPTKQKESLKVFFTAPIMNHLLRNGDGHLKKPTFQQRV